MSPFQIINAENTIMAKFSNWNVNWRLLAQSFLSSRTCLLTMSLNMIGVLISCYCQATGGGRSGDRVETSSASSGGGWRKSEMAMVGVWCVWRWKVKRGQTNEVHYFITFVCPLDTIRAGRALPGVVVEQGVESGQTNGIFYCICLSVRYLAEVRIFVCHPSVCQVRGCLLLPRVLSLVACWVRAGLCGGWHLLAHGVLRTYLSCCWRMKSNVGRMPLLLASVRKTTHSHYGIG